MPVVLNILRNHVKMVLVFDGYCQMVVLAIGVAVLLLGWKKNPDGGENLPCCYWLSLGCRFFYYYFFFKVGLDLSPNWGSHEVQYWKFGTFSFSSTPEKLKLSDLDSFSYADAGENNWWWQKKPEEWTYYVTESPWAKSFWMEQKSTRSFTKLLRKLSRSLKQKWVL